jgi:hypothetical protein
LEIGGGPWIYFWRCCWQWDNVIQCQGPWLLYSVAILKMIPSPRAFLVFLAFQSLLRGQKYVGSLSVFSGWLRWHTQPVTEHWYSLSIRSCAIWSSFGKLGAYQAYVVPLSTQRWKRSVIDTTKFGTVPTSLLSLISFMKTGNGISPVNSYLRMSSMFSPVFLIVSCIL